MENSGNPKPKPFLFQLMTLRDQDAGQLISGTLSILAVIQLMCTAAAAWHGAVEANVHIRGHHIQLPLGLAIIVFGVAHTVYCCTYFYVGFPVWTGAIVMLQATLTWKIKSKCKFITRHHYRKHA